MLKTQEELDQETLERETEEYFNDTRQRPKFCPYCGAEMKDDEYGMGGYSLGGVGEFDSFLGRCMSCDKIVDVFMDASNYDEETLAGFRKHGFMMDDVEK